MSPRGKRIYMLSPAEGTPPTPNAVIVPRLMRIPEAAKYLSATIWQVETLLREKTIPSFVLGKRRVVDRLELDRYVEARNSRAKAEQADSPVSSVSG